VPVDLWERVNSRLRDPKRLTQRDSQARHLMSMIARCHVAGCPMTPSQRGGEPWHLRCHANHGVQVKEELLDEIAVDLIVGYLSRPDVIEELTRRDGDDPELERVRAELAATRKQLSELAAAVGDKSVSVAMAAKAEPPLLADEQRLAKRERELMLPSALASFVGPEDEVRARWKAAPLSAQREVARLLFSPALLGELRVGPDVRGSWCRHESHDRPQQTCTHRVLARLEFIRD
jgi:site-specific DNA recombinase